MILWLYAQLDDAVGKAPAASKWLHELLVCDTSVRNFATTTPSVVVAAETSSQLGQFSLAATLSMRLPCCAKDMDTLPPYCGRASTSVGFVPS